MSAMTDFQALVKSQGRIELQSRIWVWDEARGVAVPLPECNPSPCPECERLKRELDRMTEIALEAQILLKKGLATKRLYIDEGRIRGALSDWKIEVIQAFPHLNPKPNP